MAQHTHKHCQNTKQYLSMYTGHAMLSLVSCLDDLRSNWEVGGWVAMMIIDTGDYSAITGW